MLGSYFFENNLNCQGYLDFINDEIAPQMMKVFNYNLFRYMFFFRNCGGFKIMQPFIDTNDVSERAPWLSNRCSEY